MEINLDYQMNLYGLNKNFDELKTLYKNNKLPCQILLSGQKGSGKSTLAFHFINFILSENEDYPYDLDKREIHGENRSYKLIKNNVHPNFNLIDIKDNKKTIDINQVRNLIQNLNKSSFNEKPRFVLIDNLEYLNLNSINALLKILEEPPENTHFILINSDKGILPTLKSRCLNFKISLSNKVSYEIIKYIFKDDLLNILDESFLYYYSTPGKIYRLINFANQNNINLKKNSLKNFLSIIIDNGHYKKDVMLTIILNDLIEFFLIKNISKNSFDFFSYFLKKIENIKKYNLDEESFFMEFKTKLLDG